MAVAPTTTELAFEVGDMRRRCRAMELVIHRFIDEIAEHTADTANSAGQVAAVLALCGDWRLRPELALLRFILEFLFDPEPTWARYPPFMSLPIDPVMPYDDGHFMSPAFYFPTAWRLTLAEDAHRVYARTRSLAHEHNRLQREAARALRQRCRVRRGRDRFLAAMGFTPVRVNPRILLAIEDAAEGADSE